MQVRFHGEDVIILWFMSLIVFASVILGFVTC